MRKIAVVAGIPIDDLDLPETLRCMEAFIATGRPHQVATVNVDFIVNAWDDPELRHILQDCDLLTADGMPVVWAARALGVPLGGRVTGADLTPALVELAAARGWRVFFLGARPGVAARAAAILQQRHPALQVAGVFSPPLSPVVEMPAGIVEQVRAARPHILLVAFGNPKQEKWIHMHLQRLDVPVCMGIGGTLDFIAGEMRRAPLWMQKSGLEWLFRLLQEPRRLWRRYGVGMFQFSRFFILQWRHQRSGKHWAEIPVQTDPLGEDLPGLALGGALTLASRPDFSQQIHDALLLHPRLHIDLSAVDFIDSAGLGALIHLTRQARAAGGDLVLCSLQPPIRRMLETIRLDRFFTLDIPSPASATPPAPVEDAHAFAPTRSVTHTRAAAITPTAGPPGEFATLALPRAFDNETSPALRTLLDESLAGSPRLVLDFQHTAFLDSAGIAVLLAAHRAATRLGGELRLSNLNQDLQRTLELSGIAPVFNFHPTGGRP